MKRRVPPSENELERYWGRVTHPCLKDDRHRACGAAHPNGRCLCDDRCLACSWRGLEFRFQGMCADGCAGNHDDPYVNYPDRAYNDGCGVEECCPAESHMAYPGNNKNPYFEEPYRNRKVLAAYDGTWCAKDGLLCGKPECGYCCGWSEYAEEWARRSIVDQLADLGRELVAESGVIERDRTRLEVA